MAAGLVKAYEGHKFVYLHLLCQGFENIGKALILINNYRKYGPMLKPVYGHDLVKLLDELRIVYGSAFLSDEASAEVEMLSEFYKQHQFRYGDKLDFCLDYSSLRADQLHGSLISLLADLNQKFALLE